MEFDVRRNSDTIDVIRVSDNSEDWYNVTTLIRSRASSGVALRYDTHFTMLHVLTKTDAKNLITGIEKAIELGWLTDRDMTK